MLAVLLGFTGIAGAARKRIAVLDFTGDNAEKIQAEVVKLIKRSHTVITQDKWMDTADGMSATKVSNKNIKKVARKLKIDGVITGVVEKRRGDFIIRIQLHEGTTGELAVDQINTKTSGSRLDGTAQDDLKDELLGPIGNLEQNRGGGDDDDADSDDEEDAKPIKKVKPSKKTDDDDEEEEDAKPVKKPVAKKTDDDDEEEEDAKPVKRSGFSTHKERASDDEEEEDAKPVKKPVAKKSDDDSDDEEDNPLPTSKRPAKKDDDDEERTASKEDDEDEEEDDSSTKVRKRADHDDDGGEVSESALSPGERALDAVVGLSFTARRLGFTANADQMPAGYAGVPVPGLFLEGSFYPGAMSHKKKGLAANLGATFLVDKVLAVSTKDAAGTKYDTSELRFAVGAVFRKPIAKGAVGAMLRYGKQSFTIADGAPVPATAYSYVNPEGFLRYQVNPKILFNANLGVMAVLGTGAIQQMTQYGGATVYGIDLDVGIDYQLKKNIFARASLKVQTFGLKFKGTGAKSDPNGDGTADVSAARDSYIGAGFNVGYLY